MTDAFTIDVLDHGTFVIVLDSTEGWAAYYPGTPGQRVRVSQQVLRDTGIFDHVSALLPGRHFRA